MKKITMLAVVALSLFAIWFAAFKPSQEPAGAIHEASVSPEVSGMEKEEIKPAKVKAYPSGAKKKLGLSKSIQDDDSLHVLDSSSLPGEDRPITITHVLDEDTGETKTLIKTEPYPLIEAENDKSASILYGVKNGGVKVGRLILSADLVKVKGSVHFTVYGSMDSDGQYFLGGGATYRWR